MCVMSVSGSNGARAVYSSRRSTDRNSTSGQLGLAIGNALRFRFLFTQAHAGEFRIRKKTEWNLSSRRHAFTASDTLMNHAEIVNANVRKLRASCYLADRPNPGRCGLQPLIHFDVSAFGQFDAG